MGRTHFQLHDGACACTAVKMKNHERFICSTSRANRIAVFFELRDERCDGNGAPRRMRGEETRRGPRRSPECIRPRSAVHPVAAAAAAATRTQTRRAAWRGAGRVKSRPRRAKRAGRSRETRRGTFLRRPSWHRQVGRCSEVSRHSARARVVSAATAASQSPLQPRAAWETLDGGI
jgi:hypothetical protein